MREAGFYWVKFKGEWMVGKWNTVFWFIVSNLSVYSDSNFEEIDERIIKREI